MATQAVQFLEQKAGPEGYFVMIEAGRIDAAHHNGEATKALSETLAFDRAIEEVSVSCLPPLSARYDIPDWSRS